MEQDEKIKALLDLGRVANLPTVWSNVGAAWMLGGGEHVWRVFPLIVGASLLYCGGTTLNDAVDAEFDREFRPERPIPAGTFTVKQVWAIGGAMLGAGALILPVLAKASLVWVLALVAAIEPMISSTRSGRVRYSSWARAGRSSISRRPPRRWRPGSV